MELVKKTLARMDELWEKGVAKVGGPKDERNLLGIVLDFVAAVVKAPFKFVGGCWTFGRLLFTQPKEAWEVLLFNWARACEAGMGLIGIEIEWVVPYKGKTYRKFHGVTRAIVFGYITIIIWCFVPAAIELGYPTIAKWLFFGPIAVWFGTGLGKAQRAWRAFRLETFLIRRQAEITRAENKGVADQIAANENLAAANDTARARIQQMEQAQVETVALLNQQTEAINDLRAENARLKEEAVQAEIRKKGEGHDVIHDKRQQGLLARAVSGKAPTLNTEKNGQNLITDESEVDASTGDGDDFIDAQFEEVEK